MHVEANHGTVLLKFGSTFSLRDADRIEEALTALAPSKLVVDFTTVREFQDAGFHSLVRALGVLHDAQVTIRGLPLHQSRVLGFLGVQV